VATAKCGREFFSGDLAVQSIVVARNEVEQVEAREWVVLLLFF
jgi:hypothetical protein